MEDFNVPNPERIDMLQRLQDAIGDVPSYFWASCQVCDLEALKKLVMIASITPAIVRVLAAQTRAMSQYWSAHPQGFSQPSTPNKPTQLDPGSSPLSAPPTKKQKTSESPGGKAASFPVRSRNMQAKAAAEQRDKFRCVLTKDMTTEIAHIYPFHSIKHNEEDVFGRRHMFWDQLKNFWPDDKVKAWREELFPEGLHITGLDQAFNLITLSPNAHRQWDRGAFALKPILVSEDNTTLKIQFFWQKRQDNTQATTMSLLTLPFSTQGLDKYEGENNHGISRLIDVETIDCITSGQFFNLQTDDPIQRPLPSFKLLEMQWFLQRIAGMAGAAGDLDWEDCDEDSDYDDS